MLSGFSRLKSPHKPLPLWQVHAGKLVGLSHCAGHLPVHQADIIEVDAVKHKQANVGILESSFLQDNQE